MTGFTEIYPKVLLFGEYSIILGGAAMTLPMHEFSARFDFPDSSTDYELALESNKTLFKLADFFEHAKEISDRIETDKFRKDLEDGLYFRSDIPTGYGLGSSGALCAAILKAYATDKRILYLPFPDLIEIKPLLAAMESFFHGTSSGLDPLACFLGSPLLIRNNKIYEGENIFVPKSQWFLLDSGYKRNTGPLVECFLKNYKDPEYMNSFETNYISAITALENAIYENSKHKQPIQAAVPHALKQAMEAISSLQLQYFEDMIPAHMDAVWRSGLDTGTFFIKLLGAGGGGYFLGYTTEKSKTEELISGRGFPLIWLNHF